MVEIFLKKRDIGEGKLRRGIKFHQRSITHYFDVVELLQQSMHSMEGFDGHNSLPQTRSNVSELVFCVHLSAVDQGIFLG
jgi:hypothetical protein